MIMKRWAENVMGLDLEAEQAEAERAFSEPLEPEFLPSHKPRGDDGYDHRDKADEWMQAEERREEDERVYGVKR